MLKKILIFLIFLTVNNCGYTPIYELNENLNFKISKINFKGDRLINNYLDSKFKRYSEKKETEYILTLTSNYSKIALSKDSTGKITDYKLSLKITVDVKEININNQEKFEGYVNTFQYEEEFILQDENFKFKETNYENNIKRNLADTIYNKFIISLTKR
tara:strand:- start:82 stop:558 length:477 start_codon:yes stop_codon:yes gene_type:complete